MTWPDVVTICESNKVATALYSSLTTQVEEHVRGCALEPGVLAFF